MHPDDLIPTRLSLINRLKNWEDDLSWQDFFNTYWKFIYGVAVKAGLSDAEAQDVVQETVVTVAKKIGDFQVDPSRGSFKAWLTHTTHWRINDQFRKRKPSTERIEPPSDDISSGSGSNHPLEAVGSDLEELWTTEWEQNLLEVALDKIRDRVGNDALQMFYLHIVKGWPAAQVAETVGTKLHRVYFAKYKVSRHVKREIERLKKEVI